ncbi:MAG TPA: DUF192 domain-containing protein [Chloroflexi bacterium]|nr:MAG: hypothetical protein B6I38_05975 [Anaerolineaceae bacterium 4572_5.1]HEY85684.1 DUF192 domain-containing protein [Chloroflexota bacterium]
MIIKNQNKNATLVRQGKVADTFFTRLKGLLGSPPLQEGEGLLLKGEKSIHTLFMTFPIDVIYLDHALEIIKITSDMRPWKLGPYVSQSTYILELPVGVISRTNSTVGDHLIIT